MYYARQRAAWEQVALLVQWVAAPYAVLKMCNFPFLDDIAPPRRQMASRAQLMAFAKGFGK